MARKDVDLVIRAKDEAEKVVTSITKALNGFVKAQEGLQASGEETESSLSQLGSAIGNLDKQIKGLDLGNALVKDMDRAGDAVARLETNVAKTSAEMDQLSRATTRAEAVASRYSEQLAKAASLQERQTAAVAKARKESKSLETAYEQSTKAVKKLSDQQTKLPGLIEQQEKAVAKTAARYEKLSAEMAATSKPSATLTRNFEASERSLTSQNTKLAKLRKSYSEVQAELVSAGAAAQTFATQSEAASKNLAKQEQTLARVDAVVDGLKTSTKAAGAEQVKLSKQLDTTTSTFNRQSAALERAEAQYVDLAVAANKFDDALAKTANLSKSNLEQQLVDQGIAVQKAAKHYDDLRNSAQKYAQVAQVAGPPTREMSQQMNFLAQRAEEAQYKLLAQEDTLRSMGAAYREVSSDLSSISAGQARFIAAQEKLGATMREVAEDGYRERKAIREVHKEATNATGSVNRLAAASERQGSAARRGATETGRLADAYRRLYGDTRRSLSYTQRLRGEVLSLIAAYGGFYGVIQLLGGVVDAYQTLEAAQSRLNVALDGDVGQAAKEMDFLRRTADRLGIDLGTLATEYSKFAIATKGTNLEGANTRKIFLSVAESARVNRSSTAEMSGVFTALTQIVSKGAVQMEELRQQLGDRLPGAIKIMADGLNVGTAELIKMMEAGEVTADALVPFSEELDRRFGPGLAEALRGTTVSLGRLKNAAFQALVQFGRGGFIDAFTKLANDLTDVLKSSDFAAFMERASRATALLIDTVGVLAQNFDLVVAAGTAFLGLKLTPLIVYMASQFTKLPGAIAASATGLVAFTRGAQTASGAAAGAAASVGRLTLAIRALMSSTGIGLVITAISAGIGLWATRADEASTAMNDHKAILDEVRNAYDAVAGSVKEWKDNLNELTETEAQENLERIEKAASEAEKALDRVLKDRGGSFATRLFGYEFVQASSQFQRELAKVFEQYSKGEIAAEDLVEATDKITAEYRGASDANARMADAAIDAAKGIEETSKAAEEARKILKTFSEDSEEAQEAFDELGNSAKETAKSLEEIAEEKAAKFTAAMEAMGEGIETVNRELEYLEASNAIDKLGKEALDNATNLDELAAAMERIRLAKDALDSEYISGAVGGSLVDRIIGVESGGDPTAKNKNSTATGLGQFIESTWLRMFKQYFPDRAAGMTNAAILALRTNADDSRKMVDLYLRENAKHLKTAGIAITDANLYLSHFLGPGGASKLIGSAPGSIANNVLDSGQISANKSILDGKTREQVIAWAQRKVGISEQELDLAESMQESERKRAEEAAKEAARRQEDIDKQRAGTAEQLEDNNFAIEQQRLKNAEQEREAAIREAIREARKDDPNITDAEIARIREQVGALHDLETAADRANAGKERAEKAEERMNQLLAQRNSLEQQLDLAKTSGDTALQEELRLKMAEINTELLAAIENAKALWAAVGGPEADTAIEKLNAAQASAQRFGMEAQKNYLDWSRVADLLVTGLASAFDTFAQKVADGESATDAAKEAFLQFAADFLLQIARMIIQQAIFNALKSAFGGTNFGSMIGIGAGHTGGYVGSSRVGSGNQTRQVNPAVFAGATRYHSGGMIGLRPGEVPIIAKQGEEMLTRDDPRHMLNGGGAGNGGGQPAQQNVKVVNAIDSGSFIDAGLNSKQGERAILNFMRANAGTVKSIIG